MQGCGHLLIQQINRTEFDPLPALLDDHIALEPHPIGVEAQAAHAISLERHHFGEALLGHALVIDRSTSSCRCILATAKPGDRPGKDARSSARRRFVHQVLEKVRNPGAAGRIIGAADPIRDDVSDNRRPMIGDTITSSPFSNLNCWARVSAALAASPPAEAANRTAMK